MNEGNHLKIASLGLGDVFQNIRIFKDLKHLDNELIALLDHHTQHVFTSFLRLYQFYKSEKELKAKALELLRKFDI